MDAIHEIMRQLGEVYVILQDIEVRGKYAEELVFSQQKIEQAVNQLRAISVEEK